MDDFISKEELAHIRFSMMFNESTERAASLRKDGRPVERPFSEESDGLLEHMNRHLFYLEIMPYDQADRGPVEEGQPLVTYTVKIYGPGVESGTMFFDRSCDSLQEAMSTGLGWYRDVVMPILG